MKTTELTYVPAPETRTPNPDGSWEVSTAPSPEWMFGFWRSQYQQKRGKNRKQVVERFSRDFKVEIVLAERMLRDEIPSRVEPDGTLIFTVNGQAL
jgi:hypothetical protein